MHAFAVGQRLEMAENAVARRGASFAFACRAFGVSETCYRYGPKLRAENEEIADLMVGLTDARKTSGLGMCVLHLRNAVRRICCTLELNLCPLMICSQPLPGNRSSTESG